MHKLSGLVHSESISLWASLSNHNVCGTVWQRTGLVIAFPVPATLGDKYASTASQCPCGLARIFNCASVKVFNVQVV